MENETLELLKPPPEENLRSWLAEFYDKPVDIASRQLLRHRDLSRVERITIADSLPASLIYKAVLPPWDVELDLHQRVLVPSVTSSPVLYMSAHHADATVLFLEDLGPRCLKSEASEDLAVALGKKLARLHRAFGYRTDDLKTSGILQTITPANYVELTTQICSALARWGLLQNRDFSRTVPVDQSKQGDQRNQENQKDQEKNQAVMLHNVAHKLVERLEGEPISLVHGDFYAENLIPRSKHLNSNNVNSHSFNSHDENPAFNGISAHTDDTYTDEIYIIDWSWFAIIGVPLMDLATVTMDHFKNGELLKYRQQIIESYCFEYGRAQNDTEKLLPAAETLSRLLFLYWLVVRRKRGIMGTTVGHIDNLIIDVLGELESCRGSI